MVLKTFRAMQLGVAISLASVLAHAQTTCTETQEGRVCQVQQPIIIGAPVVVALQKDLGLVTVAGGCSGTLVNRFWVLTADHCVSTNGQVGGPAQAFANLPITATWSTRSVTPTRYVRNWNASGLDVALVFLGAGDFGPANIQLFFVNQVDTTLSLTKFGQGLSAYANAGPPPRAATQNGYNSATFTPSAASATAYTLPANTAGQVGNGGDSGGPDHVRAPNGVLVGIAGVQSTCRGWNAVPGQPTPSSPSPTWRWVTSIASCTSAAIETARFDIVQIIQEGRIACPDTSAACAVAETTSLPLMLR